MARKSGGGKQPAWSREDILEGVRIFSEKNGRFPMSRELDKFENLPSARSIQRSFGGLVALKKELGIADEYHRGAARSKISTDVGIRGIKIEDQMRDRLTVRFGAVAVHCQPRIEGSKERLDFVVYHKSGHFGVDVFYAASAHSLQGSVNLKQTKYANFNGQLYFVCVGDFTDKQLESIVETKENKLRKNSRLVSAERFFNTIKFFRPLIIS